MINLAEVIDSAMSLEPLSATASRLADIVSAEDFDLREVAEVVSYDQALTGRVLRSANSVLRGGSREIATVKDAVARLGSGVVLSYAIASAMRGRMAGALPAYGYAEGELFQHSVCAALAAETLKARCRGAPVPPEAFTAALLHDVGKLVLGRFLDEDVLRILSEASDGRGMSRLDAETEVLGVHHAELGALVSRAWNLPDSITHGIKFHHAPAEAAEHVCEYANGGGRSTAAMDAVAALTQAADALAHRVAPHANQQEPEVAPHALAALKLDPAALEAAAEATGQRLAELLSSYC
ncbi:MAG: HDOD domain-containing protein [Planctomycetes bacterium]|nr:HDOD domain-containing protein [Planctomycetota bacterium]